MPDLFGEPIDSQTCYAWPGPRARCADDFFEFYTTATRETPRSKKLI
jgi:hypothetical protein